MRKKVFLTFLSILFTIIIVIGNSFYVSDSFKFIEKNIIINLIITIISLAVFYLIFSKIFEILEHKEFKILDKLNKSKIINKIKKNKTI